MWALFVIGFAALILTVVFGSAKPELSESGLTEASTADTNPLMATLSRSLEELIVNDWTRWAIITSIALFIFGTLLRLLPKLSFVRSSIGVTLAADGRSKRAQIAILGENFKQVILNNEDALITETTALLLDSADFQASDMHIIPTEAGHSVSLRVEGELFDVMILPSDIGRRLSSRIQVLSAIEPYLDRKPQDGRLVVNDGKRSLEARVSTLPTERGIRLALRFIQGSKGVPTLDKLGLNPALRHHLERALAKAQGIFLVTGPVGSGKSTTLYAALEWIHSSRGETTSILTLEDPVELKLPFAAQTPIAPRAGLDFATALRSALRQDPNVLMVGEIRDQETAQIASQAGLTGHLILSTVHAQGTVGPYLRLADMNVEPFVLASSVVGCMSQRLVRTLCPSCRIEAPIPSWVKERLIEVGAATDIVLETGYIAPGCENCGGTGVIGRALLSELLVPSEALQAALVRKESPSELEKLAREARVGSMLQSGLELVEAGKLDAQELLRVLG